MPEGLIPFCGILVIGIGTASFIVYCLLTGLVLWRKRVNKEKLKRALEQEALKLVEVATKQIRERELQMKTITNTKALNELLVHTATQEDYDNFVLDIAEWVGELYRDYKFQFLQPAEEDFESGYAVVFQMFRPEKPELFDNLFKLAIDRGLTDAEINETFVKLVKEGKVLELGDIEIDERGTGMSSILQGDDLRLFITFVTPEYKEKKEEILKEREEKLAVENEKRAEADKKREAAYRAIVEASAVLSNMTKEVVEQHPELTEAYEEANKLYRESL